MTYRNVAPHAFVSQKQVIRHGVKVLHLIYIAKPNPTNRIFSLYKQNATTRYGYL